MKPTGATKEFVNAGGRPWKLYTKFSTLREPFQIQDADGSTVAIVTYDPMTTEPEDADDNAALIVRAVNERERLREALRQVRAMFFKHAQAGGYVEKGKLIHVDNKQHPWIPDVEAPRAIAIIDAALNEVEG